MKIKYIFLTLTLSLFFLSTGLMAQQVPTKLSDIQLKTLDGETTTLAHYQGEVTIINLWATWCTPCVKEMPVLERINQEYGPRNVKIVGIAVFSDKSKIDDMLDLTRVTYPILIADKAQAVKFGDLSNIPQTLIMDTNGRIVKRLKGTQSLNSINHILNKLISNNIISSKNN